MERYVAARPDIFFTGRDGSLRSNRVLCQLAGQYAIDMFIGSSLQIDGDANSSTVTEGRLAGFGGAPNMGHDPHGRRHATPAWLDLATGEGASRRGRKLVVQMLQTLPQGRPGRLRGDARCGRGRAGSEDAAPAGDDLRRRRVTRRHRGRRRVPLQGHEPARSAATRSPRSRRRRRSGRVSNRRRPSSCVAMGWWPIPKTSGSTRRWPIAACWPRAASAISSRGRAVSTTRPRGSGTGDAGPWTRQRRRPAPAEPAELGCPCVHARGSSVGWRPTRSATSPGSPPSQGWSTNEARAPTTTWISTCCCAPPTFSNRWFTRAGGDRARRHRSDVTPTSACGAIWGARTPGRSRDARERPVVSTPTAVPCSAWASWLPAPRTPMSSTRSRSRKRQGSWRACRTSQRRVSAHMAIAFVIAIPASGPRRRQRPAFRPLFRSRCLCCRPPGGVASTSGWRGSTRCSP